MWRCHCINVFSSWSRYSCASIPQSLSMTISTTASFKLSWSVLPSCSGVIALAVALRRSAVICLASGLVKSRNPSPTPRRISARPHLISINGTEIITITIQCQLLDLTLILALLSQTKNEGLLLGIDLRSHPQVFTHLPAMPNGLSGTFLNRERAT